MAARVKQSERQFLSQSQALTKLTSKLKDSHNGRYKNQAIGTDSSDEEDEQTYPPIFEQELERVNLNLSRLAEKHKRTIHRIPHLKSPDDSNVLSGWEAPDTL